MSVFVLFIYGFVSIFFFFFFFNDTATTEIYTLSLHDALPICSRERRTGCGPATVRSPALVPRLLRGVRPGDRKSTRLNSSHGYISYAVFCLKKKKKEQKNTTNKNTTNATNHISPQTKPANYA